MTERSNSWRLRNYFRTKIDEIYFEQTPGTQRRIDKFNTRVRKLNKRYNPVKREKVPAGKDYVRRRLVGSAVGLAEILDGQHAQKRPIPKPRRRKKRKSRVVK